MGLLVILIVLSLTPVARSSGYDRELLSYEQPLNHARPQGPKLDQRVELLIPDVNSPTGQAAIRPVFYILGNHPDPTLLDLPGIWRSYGSPRNVIFVRASHRGYDGAISRQQDQSRPEYVDIEQAIQDFGVVRDRLGKRFKGPWLVVGYGYGGSMATEFASRWPESVSAVLCSSGVLASPLASDAFDRAVYKEMGPEVYARLAGHMANLAPDRMFDKKWQNRELLVAVLHGLIQYPSLRENLALFRQSTLLPTFLFLPILKTMDRSVGRAQAWNFARSNAKKELTREEALSGKFNWRYWRWQQCNGLAAFEVGSKGRDSVFTRTAADHCAECLTLFDTSPCRGRDWNWNPSALVDQLKVPLVYVSGGKDPWLEFGLDPEKAKGIKHLHFPEGCHCPDRADIQAGQEVMSALLEAAGISSSN